jgi:hypothetical protein
MAGNGGADDYLPSAVEGGYRSRSMRKTSGIVVLSVAIPLVLTLASAPTFARGGGASHSSSGMGSTVGLANPSRSLGGSPVDPGVNPTQAPVPGTSGSPAADVALHAGGTRMPSAAPDRDSDAKIDAENRRLDRTVDSICKGC